MHNMHYEHRSQTISGHQTPCCKAEMAYKGAGKNCKVKGNTGQDDG